MKARGRLAFFLEALCLHVKAGNDLAYGWEQSLPCALSLPLAENPPWYWKGLSRSWPIVEHRLWFALLEELEGGGAPIGPFLDAFAAQVRRERSAEVDRFCRALPTKLSIALVLFYLPSAFLLLFGPLLLALPRL